MLSLLTSVKNIINIKCVVVIYVIHDNLIKWGNYLLSYMKAKCVFEINL